MFGDVSAVIITLTLLDQSPIRTLAVALGVLALNGSRGLYRSRLAPSAAHDTPGLLGAVFIAGSLVYMLSQSGTATLPLLGGGYGRDWWGAIGLTGVALVLVRAFGYWLLRMVRRSGMVRHRTLIVGAGLVGVEVAQVLANYPEYGLTPVAFHDPEPLPGVERDLPVLTSTSLGQSIRLSDASIVVIGYSSLPDSQLVEYLQRYHREQAEFFLVPRLYELDLGNPGEVEHVRSLSLRRLRRAAHRTLQWRIKLVLDRVVAAIMLLLLSPILLGIAVAIRVTMGAPVIFRQERVGINGERFEMLKFRSLPHAPEQAANTEWAAETTRRPTRLGRALRATSFDELPQLVNILKGEMSFVGPRPERPYFVGEFATRDRRYNYRHRVPSGLTGLSQVSGLRGDTSITERARFDNSYVESWSLMGDFKILMRTVRELFPSVKK
ncbi:MAG: exopolysaccharide biosynthesis polyprenyl glycosylphosphotransferase [Acidimicrobiales bacterium]